MDRMKVMFVIPSLVGGGAERVAVLLIEHLDRDRFQPSLVLFEDRCDYTVRKDMSLTCLNKRSQYDLPLIIWRLARAYERDRPDIVLGFMDYANLIAVLARRLSRAKPRVLLTEHNHASIDLKYMPRSRGLRWAIPRLYPKSDGVVCVSRGVADDLVVNFGVPREKTTVVYNPVDIDFISSAANEDVDHPWFAYKERPIFIAVGRLTVQKGFPHLLRAFAQVTTRFPCRLIILGDGSERGALVALARKLGIEQDVDFLGFQRRTFRLVGHADIFVLSSLWEGLGMAIIEAMACGTPVISTRCPSGPDEIITDEVNGLLVPVADEGALAGAMLRLLKDKRLAAKLAQAGRRRAEDFAVGKIVGEYEQLISNVATSL